MDATQLLARYEQLARLTEQMRVVAEHGAWDQLTELELHRSQVLAEVKPMDAAITLSVAEDKSRDEFIRSTLSLDSEIRKLVQDHMDEIQVNLASNQNAQRLRQAYGV